MGVYCPQALVMSVLGLTSLRAVFRRTVFKTPLSSEYWSSQIEHKPAEIKNAQAMLA